MTEPDWSGHLHTVNCLSVERKVIGTTGNALSLPHFQSQRSADAVAFHSMERWTPHTSHRSKSKRKDDEAVLRKSKLLVAA